MLVDIDMQLITDHLSNSAKTGNSVTKHRFHGSAQNSVATEKCEPYSSWRTIVVAICSASVLAIVVVVVVVVSCSSRQNS